MHNGNFGQLFTLDPDGQNNSRCSLILLGGSSQWRWSDQESRPPGQFILNVKRNFRYNNFNSENVNWEPSTLDLLSVSVLSYFLFLDLSDVPTTSLVELTHAQVRDPLDLKYKAIYLFPFLFRSLFPANLRSFTSEDWSGDVGAVSQYQPPRSQG